MDQDGPAALWECGYVFSYGLETACHCCYAPGFPWFLGGLTLFFVANMFVAFGMITYCPRGLVPPDFDVCDMDEFLASSPMDLAQPVPTESLSQTGLGSPGRYLVVVGLFCC